jgi:urease accessory protein
MNLRLAQLGDSALPIGGYCHSWGLEAAVHAGLVHDPATLESWTRDWLTFAVGPLEGVVLMATGGLALQEDWPGVVAANLLLDISLTPGTLRQASRDMGQQLLSLAEFWPWAARAALQLRSASPDEPWHHAAIFGCLAAVGGGAPVDAAAIYLHQAALGMIGAGVRVIPIGHTHGQQILARLQDDLQGLAVSLAGRPLGSAGSICPAYEVYCHDQSGLYTRLFRS